MKKTNLIFRLFFSTIFLSVLFSSNAFSEDENIVVINKVFKQVIEKDKDGNVTYSYVEPKLALPGDVMLYTTTFENVGTAPAEGVVINNPMPNNSIYRMNSAAGKNTTIIFSIDNGKSFGDPEKLVVKDKDGNEWTAKPESYTHIRWVYNKPLAPGEKGEVSFKTQIQGND